MPDIFSTLQIGTAAAGIKKAGIDCVVIILPKNSCSAVIFTQNQYCAAPVTVGRQHISQTNNCRALLVNSGNANCGLGEAGIAVAHDSANYVAERIGCNANQVLPFSTGVINQPLPYSTIKAGIDGCFKRLGEQSLGDAATAIMTTDTVSKQAQQSAQVGDYSIHVAGIAKGSGMIHPNMATMLAFLFTNVTMPAALLQKALKHAADQTFNRISVDGDTSTNDACTLSTVTDSNCVIEDEHSPLWQPFIDVLTSVCKDLAIAIVDDAEGATKRFFIQVESCQSEQEGLRAAYTIAHSPLVKTALFAGDPNLGRIAAALGRSGIENIDWDKVNMYLGNECIMEKGKLPVSYCEDALQEIMSNRCIDLRIELNRGTQRAHVWSCDLSYEYVKINAEYRS